MNQAFVYKDLVTGVEIEVYAPKLQNPDSYLEFFIDESPDDFDGRAAVINVPATEARRLAHLILEDGIEE